MFKYEFDRLLTSDEWGQVRGLITENLKALPVCWPDIEGLTFVDVFERAITRKLSNAGFNLNDLSDHLNVIIRTLDIQGIRFDYPKWESRPYGLPDGCFEINKDLTVLWVDPDIAAALRAYVLLNEFKRFKSKESVEIFLKSFDLFLNLSRAGAVPALAVSEAAKKVNSMTTRDLKKELIQKAVENVLNGLPIEKKTLGMVWGRLDSRNKKFEDSAGNVYSARTKGNEYVEISGATLKKPLRYAKRSLQLYINKSK
jgi:hypothetical protein